MRSIKILATVVSAVALFIAVPIAIPTTAQTEETEKETEVINKVDKFKPAARAGGNELKRIIRIEHKIWGGTSIMGAVGCESGYRSWATNGSYRGAIQADGIFEGTLWPGTPRKVEYHTTKKNDSGDTVKTKHIGTLPRNPGAYHAWAAIRVGTRAASEDGPDTYWACANADGHYW